MKLFSLDAETSGLYGDSLAIAVEVTKNGQVIAQFQARLADKPATAAAKACGSEKDKFVEEVILPAIMPISTVYQTVEELEEAFWQFFQDNKEDSLVIAHMGSPVESGLFRRCVERDLDERQWNGPYPGIHDVATLLQLLGEDASSVDAYVKKNGINVPFEGASHHPMYDAVAARVVWEHAYSNIVS